MCLHLFLGTLQMIPPSIKLKTDYQMKQEQIETVTFSRYIVNVGNEKVPFTISLLGFKD